jgi:hypothetical protein
MGLSVSPCNVHLSYRCPMVWNVFGRLAYWSDLGDDGLFSGKYKYIMMFFLSLFMVFLLSHREHFDGITLIAQCP